MKITRRGMNVIAISRGQEAVWTYRMNLAMNLVKARAELLTSIQGPPPSYPGAPPHMMTGELNRSHTVEVFRLGRLIVGRVSNFADHAFEVEFGSDTTLARPWLRRSLYETRDDVVSILKFGI